MTTIIANRKGMCADKKAIGGDYGIYNVDKIVELPDGTLFGIAGIRLEPEFIIELFNSFIKENSKGLSNIIGIINFILTIKENSNVKDIEGNEYLFCNKHNVTKVYSSGVIQTIKNEEYLGIGSGSEIVATAIITAKKVYSQLTFEDIFEIVSSLDNNTSTDFDFKGLKKSS